MIAIEMGEQNGTITLGNYFLASYYAQFDYSAMSVDLGVSNRGAWKASIGKASDLIPTNNFTVQLNNTLNTLITGSVYVGTPEQYLPLTYGTYANITAVENINCSAKACSQYKYNSTASSTSFDTENVLSTDLMTLVQNQSAIPFGFQSSDKPITQALALAPIATGVPSYVDKLYEYQKIGTKMVSWSMTSVESSSEPPTYPSQVTFGVAIPDSYAGNLTSHTILASKETLEWNFNFTGLYYHFDSSNLTDNDTTVQINTGTPQVMSVGEATWNWLVKKFESVGFTCDEYCYSNSSCDSFYFTLDYLTINIDNIAYSIPPKGYTWRQQGYKPTAKCMIAVTKGSSSSIVLGTSFLNSFYAEFNYDSNEVSLGVNSRNPWTPIVRKASDMLPNKNITVELNNTLNQWLGPIFIGEPQQYLPVQYVTSTNVTSVETNACERDCQDYEYWPANSTSASEWTNTTVYRDVVSLQTNETAISFVFQTRNQTIYQGSGALGLAPSTTVPNYIDTLYADRQIEEKILSFSITAQVTDSPPSNPSLVAFGSDFNSSFYQGNLTYHNTTSESAWTLNLNSIYYGYTNISTLQNYSIASINTASNLAFIVDETTWTFLTHKFTQVGFSCNKVRCSSVYKCAQLTTTLNSIKVVIDDQYYSVPAEGYTQDQQSVVEGAQCVVAIESGAESGTIQLGAYFLASFYTSLNYTNMTVGLAVNSKAEYWDPDTGNATKLLPSNNFIVTMNNTLNSWLGPIYIGTPVQTLPVNYLTNIAYTQVENNDCVINCAAQTYDHKASSTSKLKDGDVWQDQVNLNSSISSIAFQFLSTPYTSFSASGNLGLAPYNGQTQSYVNQLMQDRRIGSRIVSWSFATQETDEPASIPSIITFGEGMSDAYNGSLSDHNSQASNWVLNFKSIYYGYQQINALQLNNDAFVATSSNLALQFDSATWAVLNQTFVDIGFDCTTNDEFCGSTKPCSEMVDKMDYIKIIIDEDAFWVPPMGYTMRQQNLTSDFTCLIAAHSGAQDGTIVLGSYFLASYYAEFDYDHMQISFGINKKAPWMPFIRNATQLVSHSNFTVKLQNSNNVLSSQFFLGTPLQALTVIYSSQQAVTCVQTEESRFGEYHFDNSSTASNGYRGMSNFTSDFASASSIFQPPIPYGFIQSKDCLDERSGVLGLGQAQGSYPSFINSLRTDGQIDKSVVSWSVTTQEVKDTPPLNATFVEFGNSVVGGYYGGLVTHNSSLTSWTLNFNALYYSWFKAPLEYDTAIIDTQSSLLMKVDNDTWSLLTQNMTEAGFNCTDTYCMSDQNCSALYANMSGIKIVIDDSYYAIPPIGMTYRQQGLVKDATCLLAISNGAADKTIELGTYFLASYYASFDYDAMQMQLGLNARQGLWNASIGNSSDLEPSVEFSIQLNNTDNNWEGPLYIGTPPQYLSVNYLTLVTGIFVESSNCSLNCSGFEYNSSASETAMRGYQGQQDEPDTNERWTDYVTIDTNGTSIPMGFQTVDSFYYGPSGGGLGLGPSQGDNPSFVDALYHDNKIKKRLVSWSITTDETSDAPQKPSQIKFGSSIPDAYEGDLFLLNATENQWKFSDCTIYYGKYYAVNDYKYMASINTMSSLAMKVDDAIWDSFKSNFTNAGFECTDTQCGSISECTDLYPKLEKIEVVFNSTAFFIPPTGYTYRKQSKNADYKCMIAIESGLQPGNVTLGTYFMANFYAEFDYELLQVGLGINTFAAWNSTIGNSSEINVLPKTMPTWAIFAIVFFSIAFVVIIALIIVTIVNKKKLDKVKIRNEEAAQASSKVNLLESIN